MVRRYAAAVGLAMLVAACGAGAGDGTATPSTSSTSVSSTVPIATDLDDELIVWCAARTAFECAYSLWGVDGDAAAEWCLIDPQRCSDPPSTTIPPPETTTPVATTRPVVEPLKESHRRILRIVGAAHPGEPIEVALVLAAPLGVTETEAVSLQLGLPPRMAWRTDYACIDASGPDGWPSDLQAVREAPFDGPAMVAERREQATHTTITGFHIFEAGLTRLLRSGEALREPGVSVAAFSAAVLPGDVAALAGAPPISAVRVYQPEAFDLPDAEVPDCESSAG
jgi:hypothetical protein